ncbi:hypothetical protein CLAIMM_02233, partial [Cladophialophora immunda]
MTTPPLHLEGKSNLFWKRINITTTSPIYLHPGLGQENIEQPNLPKSFISVSSDSIDDDVNAAFFGGRRRRRQIFPIPQRVLWLRHGLVTGGGRRTAQGAKGI